MLYPGWWFLRKPLNPRSFHAQIEKCNMHTVLLPGWTLPLRPAALSMLQGKAFGATSTELGNCWRVEGIFWIEVLELVVLWIWLNIPFFILEFWGCCVERLIGGFKVSTLPLWKMMEWKSVGMMTFPTEWKVIKFHGSKPPTSIIVTLPIKSQTKTRLSQVKSPWSISTNQPVQDGVPQLCLLAYNHQITSSLYLPIYHNPKDSATYI